MKTYYFKLMDGTTVPIQAATPDEARAQARQLQARVAAGQAPPGWDMGRVAGLAGRAGVEGLVEGAGTLASLPADALYNVGVAATKGLDYLAGTDTGAEFGMPVTNMVTGAGDAAADALSLPEARTDNEKLAMAIGKGAIGALPGLGIGSALRAGGGVARTAGNILRGAPATQVASGAAAGGASEYTMQKTANPTMALLAGLGAGGAATAGMAGASTARVALRPLTKGGREQIVGDVLNMSATDAPRAIQKLDRAGEIIPGSKPLSGVAARDPGLINLQRGVERMDPQRRFAQNIEDANNARHQALRGVTMTPDQVDQLSKARTAKADLDTAALFDTPQMQAMRVPTSSIMRELHALKQDRRLYARQPVQEAVREARNQIMRMSKVNRQTGQREINPGVLYSIRQNLAQQMSGAIRSDAAPNVKLAGGTGGKILDMIDNEIENAAPGFKAYMADLAQSGQARERGKLGYEAYDAGISRGPGGVTVDEPFLNLARLRQAYQRRARELSPAQRDTFERVLADLERSSLVNSPSVRSAGSDTMQNLSVASAIGRVFGGGAVDSALSEAAQRMISRLPIIGSRDGDTATLDLLVEAMLDPKVASALMRKATPGNIDFANSVLNQVLQGGRTAGQASAFVIEDAKGNRYDINGNPVR